MAAGTVRTVIRRARETVPTKPDTEKTKRRVKSGEGNSRTDDQKNSAAR